MIKATVLPALAALIFAACGEGDGVDFCSAFPADPLCHKTYSGGDVCAQAREVIFAGFDEGCAHFPDCCICQCWLAGRQIPESENPCTCGRMESPVCDEEFRTSAEQCLADPSVCQQEAVDSIWYFCADWIQE